MSVFGAACAMLVMPLRTITPTAAMTMCARIYPPPRRPDNYATRHAHACPRSMVALPSRAPSESTDRQLSEKVENPIAASHNLQFVRPSVTASNRPVRNDPIFTLAGNAADDGDALSLRRATRDDAAYVRWRRMRRFRADVV